MTSKERVREKKFIKFKFKQQNFYVTIVCLFAWNNDDDEIYVMWCGVEQIS